MALAINLANGNAAVPTGPGIGPRDSLNFMKWWAIVSPILPLDALGIRENVKERASSVACFNTLAGKLLPVANASATPAASSPPSPFSPVLLICLSTEAENTARLKNLSCAIFKVFAHLENLQRSSVVSAPTSCNDLSICLHNRGLCFNKASDISLVWPESAIKDRVPKASLDISRKPFFIPWTLASPFNREEVALPKWYILVSIAFAPISIVNLMPPVATLRIVVDNCVTIKALRFRSSFCIIL